MYFKVYTNTHGDMKKIRMTSSIYSAAIRLIKVCFVNVHVQTDGHQIESFCVILLLRFKPQDGCEIAAAWP